MTQALVADRTEHDWLTCVACGGLLYRPRFRRALEVCTECGHHQPLTAAQRIEFLFDAGSVHAFGRVPPLRDPLGFVDSEPYPRRLEEAKRRTGMHEAVQCVRGAVMGRPCVAAVMDFRFMGGSLGTGVGELIVQAAERALADRAPLLLVTASGGARMQEGALSLMQMAKTTQALLALDEAGILTITLVTDPTFAGVAASFATLTDVIVAEPGARMGFAGRRVIEQTIGQQLPPEFQSSEFLLEHGLIDAVRPRAALRATLGRLLGVAAPHEPALHEPAPHEPAPHEPTRDVLLRRPEEVAPADPWDTVRLARDVERPTTLDYVAFLIEGFEELRGDRATGDCSAVVGGVGRFDGTPVMVIGHQKGHTTQELVDRNFGMPEPAGYRKAARLMRTADKLGLPVVTFIDTQGAYPGLEAERDGQAVAIAENLRLMFELRVPIVTVVLGEGGSGGALAIGVADRVLMCANSIYSVISPEGCAAILWRDRSQAPKAASALRLTAHDLLKLGVIDAVVPEPAGGNGRDRAQAARLVHDAIATSLGELGALPGESLVARRRARFRRIGAAQDTEGESR